MTRGSTLVLLAVIGAGVFLAGLELMVTAVALPSILADLADPSAGSAWVELRKASWIINGYLLVYILTMPMAGRLADLWGVRRLFMGALSVFIVGSALAGAAQTMDQLIAARLVQALGGGVLVPVGTAAAAHLFGGAGARPRTRGDRRADVPGDGRRSGRRGGDHRLGPPGGCPRVGRRGRRHDGRPGARLALGVLPQHPDRDHCADPGLGRRTRLGLATPPGTDRPARRRAVWRGPRRRADRPDPGRHDRGGRHRRRTRSWSRSVLLATAVVASAIAVVRGLRTDDPFIDPRLFRSVPFSSATLVSLLTGYGFATAIIGAAVFVDRVLYGGPGDQGLALGALAGATALGALVSGLIVRFIPLQLVAVGGLLLSIGGLVAMSSWTPESSLESVALSLAAFGFGFGLTVTPRSTAAVEAAGRRAFGTASAIVTVARMLGMAVGLAILTAYGSTTIDRLYVEVYASSDAYRQFIPEALRDRPLRDPQVVGALEDWASREAASIMVGLFLVAAAVTVVAIPPALALGGRRGSRTRMLDDATAATDATEGTAGGSDANGRDSPEPGVAL